MEVESTGEDVTGRLDGRGTGLRILAHFGPSGYWGLESPERVSLIVLQGWLREPGGCRSKSLGPVPVLQKMSGAGWGRVLLPSLTVLGNCALKPHCPASGSWPLVRPTKRVSEVRSVSSVRDRKMAAVPAPSARDTGHCLAVLCGLGSLSSHQSKGTGGCLALTDGPFGDPLRLRLSVPSSPGLRAGMVFVEIAFFRSMWGATKWNPEPNW